MWALADGPQHNKDVVIAAQALPALAALSRSEQAVVQHVAAGAVKCLVFGSQPGKDAIIAADALLGLVALWGSTHLEVQEGTAGAVVTLAVDSPQRQTAIIAANALPGLVALLRSTLECKRQQLGPCISLQGTPKTEMPSLPPKQCLHLLPH